MLPINPVTTGTMFAFTSGIRSFRDAFIGHGEVDRRFSEMRIGANERPGIDELRRNTAVVQNGRDLHAGENFAEGRDCIERTDAQFFQKADAVIEVRQFIEDQGMAVE